jgi:RNA polymerase sigma-54 factor
MALQQNLNLKLSQNITMTAELQQAIKLLQMNSQEIQEFVDNEILENPCLEKKDEFSEVDADSIVLADEGHDSDISYDDLYEPVSSYEDSYSSVNDDYNLENFVSEEITLKQHLYQQLSVVTGLSPKQTFLCQYLIDGIQDSGYLGLDLEQEAKNLKVSFDNLEECLSVIHTFSPEGVGARNLKECLTIQAYANKILDDKMLKLLDNLDLLAKKDLKSLRKTVNVSEDLLKEYVLKLTKLSPKPGLEYAHESGVEVIPDVVVTKDNNGNLRADLNSASLPKVFMNDDYQKNSFSNKTDKKFIGDKITRANWLVKSLQQRQNTIYNTANCLLKLQRNFFLYGPEGLQPLTLKQVANEIGVHESTVSRISNEKFMQTEFGVFQFKFFFASGVATSYGNSMVGADAVKSMIKRLVEAEESTKPHSDEKLVAMLADEGVDLARRTVAKYRESLNIQSSSKRRVKM